MFTFDGDSAFTLSTVCKCFKSHWHTDFLPRPAFSGQLDWFWFLFWRYTWQTSSLSLLMTLLETNASVQITFEQGRLILRMTACISFEESRISSLKSACPKLPLCWICLAVGKHAIQRCRKQFQPETLVSDDLQDFRLHQETSWTLQVWHVSRCYHRGAVSTNAQLFHLPHRRFAFSLK